MNLRTLVEKAPMSRKMISFAAQRLMELKVESQSGAAYGEKNPERLAQRNGYRDRICETCAAHSRAAQGLILPGLLEPRRMVEKAFTAVGAGGLCAGRLDPLGDDLVQAMGLASPRAR